MKIPSRILSRLTSWKRVGELVLSPRLRQEIKNWPRFITDFIHPRKGIYTLYLRNLKRLKLRGDTFDKWPVSEIIVRDDYRLLKLSFPPATIIDLGAGIGDFCVYACLLYPKTTIYAYEPDAETYHLLIENLVANKLQGWVYPFKLAVTKKNAPDWAYINQTKGYKPLISQYPKLQRLQTTSLDQIFSLHKIKICDLLKIDIEGAEYTVLYTLSPGIFKKIRRIHMECHNFDTTRFNSQSLKRFLEKKGFIVEKRTSLDSALSILYAVNRTLLKTPGVD